MACLSIFSELIVLLWKLSSTNKHFFAYLMKTADVLTLIVPVLHHLNIARNVNSLFFDVLCVRLTSAAFRRDGLGVCVCLLPCWSEQ